MTAAAEDYVNLANLGDTGEDVPIQAESDNYEESRPKYVPILPGTYNNLSRELVRKVETDPASVRRVERDGRAIGYYFRLSGGIDLGGRIVGVEKPYFIYASTRLRDVLDFENKDERGRPTVKKGPDGKAVQISELGRYLRATGADPRGLTFNTYTNAVEQTLNTPVGVRIDWRERAEKRPDGTYPDTWLRTKDFEVSRDEKGRPTYAPEVTGFLEERTSEKGNTYFVFKKDPSGTVFRATAYVSGFAFPVKR